MAKVSQFGVIGSMSKLPPGFVFEPTDEEILFEYLRRKIFALPLPASIIPELINLSNHDPWDLPGNSFVSLVQTILYQLTTVLIV